MNAGDLLRAIAASPCDKCGAASTFVDSEIIAAEPMGGMELIRKCKKCDDDTSMNAQDIVDLQQEMQERADKRDRDMKAVPIDPFTGVPFSKLANPNGAKAAPSIEFKNEPDSGLLGAPRDGRAAREQRDIIRQLDRINSRIADRLRLDIAGFDIELQGLREARDELNQKLNRDNYPVRDDIDDIMFRGTDGERVRRSRSRSDRERDDLLFAEPMRTAAFAKPKRKPKLAKVIQLYQPGKRRIKL